MLESYWNFCLELPGRRGKKGKMLTIHQTENPLGRIDYCLLEQFETQDVVRFLTQGQQGFPALYCQLRQCGM